jgi:hypothetical protein
VPHECLPYEVLALLVAELGISQLDESGDTLSEAVFVDIFCCLEEFTINFWGGEMLFNGER